MYYEIIKVKSLGRQIEVGMRPDKEKEPILLLHGFNDTKETFIFLLDFLSKYFSVYALDFRGHGNSEWNEDGLYNPSEYFLDIDSVVRAFFHDRFHILAHSMGAALCARYAGLFPERIKSMVCLEGFSGIQPMEFEKNRIRNWIETMSSKSGKTDISRRMMTQEEAIKKLGHIYNFLPIEKIKELVKGLTRPFPGGGVVWKNDPRLKFSPPLPFPPALSRELWKSILCPALIIYGEKTHLRPQNLDEILSHFNNVEFKEIAGSTHNLHHDNPDGCIKLIDKFYSNHFGFIK